VIKRDYVKQVQVLPLALMETLDLDVEHTWGIEPAITETRLFLLVEKFSQVEAEFLHGLLCYLQGPEIEEVVVKMGPHQLPCRQIAGRAHPVPVIRFGRLYPALEKAITHAICEGEVLVVHGKALGLELDATGVGLDIRSQRFAMVVRAA
jgi:hypothetical protein